MSSYPPGYQPYDQPPGLPPPPGAPEAAAAQRRGGCRGCLTTCLVILLACAVLSVIVVAVGIYAVRQMAPNATSFGDSAKCVALRVAVTYGDRAIEQGEGTAAQKADLRRGIQQMRTQYERECGPLP